MSVVSTLTFTLGASPAIASPNNYDFSSEDTLAAAAISQQTLVTTDRELMNDTLDPMLVGTSASGGTDFSFADLPHNFDVAATIAQAKSEIGTSRATGWSQEGECVMSVRRWLFAGNANWVGGGTPVSNYQNATRVALEDVQPGDVIQYEHATYPHSWVSGVHTMLVTGVNEDGTLQIVESNVPYGSGLVTENLSFTPNPPAGFIAAVWRF